MRGSIWQFSILFQWSFVYVCTKNTLPWLLLLLIFEVIRSSSRFILHFQNCFDYFKYFAFRYELYNQSVRKPWCVALADFHSVNTPTWSISSHSSAVTECGVGKQQPSGPSGPMQRWPQVTTHTSCHRPRPHSGCGGREVSLCWCHVHCCHQERWGQHPWPRPDFAARAPDHSGCHWGRREGQGGPLGRQFSLSPCFRVARCPWHASPSCRSGARLTLTLHPSTHTTELEVLRKTSPWAALGPAVKAGARLERSKFIDLSWWLLARFIAGRGVHSSALLTLITTGTWGVCACMRACVCVCVCVCKPSDLWTFYFCTTDPCHTSIRSRPPPCSQLPRRGPSGWSPLPLGGPGSRTIFPICPFNPGYSGVFLTLLVWGASISPVSPLGTLVSR